MVSCFCQARILLTCEWGIVMIECTSLWILCTEMLEIKVKIQENIIQKKGFIIIQDTKIL